MSNELRSGRPARVWVQFELLPFDEGMGMPGQGVGARQAQAGPLPGGGGYLDESGGPELQEGPRKKFAGIAVSGAGTPEQIREAQLLRELDDMGLSNVLLQVAHAIGFDNFMRMWQLLDMLPEALTDSESAILLRMPRHRAYRRYQRNRFVEALAAAGWSQPDILAKVKTELGENLSKRHTRRLMSSRRVRTA
ncbi:MAG: hypothetical protein ACK4F4_07150 [Hylemonella sp.]|uniref:hypothetical protein n=1 Tax=Hylemonella sp. TaxID=2066020 RepID=UPI003919142B